MLKYFAACPKGLESLLLAELNALGAQQVKETVAGASFAGDAVLGMRVCLWSRFASRVLLQLTKFACHDDLELYMGAYGVPWEDYFSEKQTIAVEFTGKSAALSNTQYGAQKVKDAVCDHFVKLTGTRPSVDRRDPDILIYANLHHGEVSCGLDLSGHALFWREFERETGRAPLKENLAAAMLVRTGYTGGSFFDPMCGSGTLLWEAGLIAADIAPGLKRRHFGFFNFKTFEKLKPQWDELMEEARSRAAAGLAKAKAEGIRLIGTDADERMLEKARENAERAGLAELTELSCSRIEDLTALPGGTRPEPLTIVTNPPYGERMGNFNELILLYGALGAKLKALCPGARLGVISSSEDLLSCLRLKDEKSYSLFNGALACQLRVYTLAAAPDGAADGKAALPAPDFANRLQKNLSRLKNWAAQQGLNSYRIYDADIPEYNAAVDLYGDYAVLQEYQAPKSVAAGLARRRLLDMIAALQLTLKIPGCNLIVKERQRQAGSEQYEKNAQSEHITVTVTEGELRFKAVLDDYLDSGIFFDSRPIRALIAREAQGRDFLNLFAYTATASVSAAAGGAASTLSVDMSRTYLTWGMENFALNNINLGHKHEFLQADCLAFLSAPGERKFDLIYLDPPTFSNSKRMSRSFEVQRDHVPLIANTLNHLKDGGAVIFCCNRRGFKLNAEALAPYGFTVEDLSAATIPADYARDADIHHCYKLTFNQAGQTAEPEPLVELKAAPRWSKLLHGRTGDRPQRPDRPERSAQPHEKVWGRPQAKPRAFTGGSGRPLSEQGSDSSYRSVPRPPRGDQERRGSGSPYGRRPRRADQRREAPKPRVFGPSGVKEDL